MNIIVYHNLFKKDRIPELEFNIIPPSQQKDCFDENHYTRNAYRCLPLRIGSELGWQITCPVNFCCIWDGTNKQDGLKLFFEHENQEICYSRVAHSHFGGGILTFDIGYIIKSPKKKSLYIRGPTNSYKEGCQYFDAIIETDWLNFSFTYNIKINKKNTNIFFKKDEPICCFHFIDLEEISNQNIQIKNLQQGSLLSKAYYFLWNKRGDYSRQNEKNRDYNRQNEKSNDLKFKRLPGYMNGGFESKNSKDHPFGCPFLHFQRLNLKCNNNFNLKDLFVLYKIKIFLLFKTWKNTILNYFYNRFILKKIIAINLNSEQKKS